MEANAVIPEAAIKAAVAAVQQETYGAGWARRIATIAVKAAAPHLLAEAWEEGFDYSRRESWTEEANPYRTTT